MGQSGRSSFRFCRFVGLRKQRESPSLLLGGCSSLCRQLPQSFRFRRLEPGHDSTAFHTDAWCLRPMRVLRGPLGQSSEELSTIIGRLSLAEKHDTLLNRMSQSWAAFTTNSFVCE